MGAGTEAIPLGLVATVDAPAGVCAVVVRGFFSHATAHEMFTQLQRRLVDDATPVSVVLDLSAIDGFEPGVPARIIQWLGARAARVPVAVLVTSSPVLNATVRAGALLLPSTIYVAMPLRSEALTFAEGRVHRRKRRAVTGERLRPDVALTAIAPAPRRKDTA